MRIFLLKLNKLSKFLKFLIDQGGQVPIQGKGNGAPVGPPELSNSNFREGLLALARAMTTPENLSMVDMVNGIENTMTSRLRDFVMMNPLIFYDSKVGKDP